MNRLARVRTVLRQYASPQKAKILGSFFKTGPGQYGEGDVFIGVKVPEIRCTAKTFTDLSDNDTLILLNSPIHEERLLALFLLISHYNKGDAAQRENIIKIYLKNTHRVNNWDLVDVSAPQLLGHWLINRERGGLDQLAGSASLWERRMAIISTLAFIRRGECADTFRIARALIEDKEDLIHKAAGWMLREAGKRSLPALKDFLRIYGNKMPRTMLRYAIEKFPEEERKRYLADGGVKASRKARPARDGEPEEPST